jgi:ABC-type sugar transport system permease subunit
MPLTSVFIPIAIAVAAIAILFYIVYQYKRNLNQLRESLVQGLEVSIWDHADQAYITAKVDQVNHVTSEVAVIFEHEKNVRIFKISSVYPKSLAK